MAAIDVRDIGTWLKKKYIRSGGEAIYEEGANIKGLC